MMQREERRAGYHMCGVLLQRRAEAAGGRQAGTCAWHCWYTTSRAILLYPTH